MEKLLVKLESEYETELATTPDEECVICINAKATMQTFPCGHRVVCRKCFVKTIQMVVSQRMLPLRCVICRAKVLRLKQTTIGGFHCCGGNRSNNICTSVSNNGNNSNSKIDLNFIHWITITTSNSDDQSIKTHNNNRRPNSLPLKSLSQTPSTTKSSPTTPTSCLAEIFNVQKELYENWESNQIQNQNEQIINNNDDDPSMFLLMMMMANTSTDNNINQKPSTTRRQIFDLESGIEWYERRLQRQQQQQQQQQFSSPNHHHEQNHSCCCCWKKQSLPPSSASFPLSMSNDDDDHYHHLCNCYCYCYYNYSFLRKKKLSSSTTNGWTTHNNSNNLQSNQMAQSSTSTSSAYNRFSKTKQNQSKFEINNIFGGQQRKLQYQQRSKSTYLVPIDEEEHDGDGLLDSMSLINKHNHEQDESSSPNTHHNSTQSLIVNSSHHQQQTPHQSSSLINDTSIWNISSSLRLDNLRKYRSDSFLTTTATNNSRNNNQQSILNNANSIQLPDDHSGGGGQIVTNSQKNKRRSWHQRIIKFRPSQSSSHLTSLMNKLFGNKNITRKPSVHESSLLSSPSSSPSSTPTPPLTTTTTTTSMMN
ncbi:hypothetical protein DERF_008094 [Dermatophagoides farinae]|uniref:RING-type domain-containing protein n=1 Tax=Dermatophagoides farinae TaxID=6954 RepID=A0A922I2N9_DERFA|nr:hypothetical protein DERF_008094 [Dermatophagoides farinae]